MDVLRGSLKNTGGWMIYRKRKDGFTLLELIIVIAIMIFLSGIIIPTIVKSVYSYKNHVNRSLELASFDNAMLNLDSLCNGPFIISFEANNTEYLSTLGNNIVIEYLDNYESGDIKKKIIYLNDEKLKVRTISKEGNILVIGNNILLNNTTDFKVTTKGNLIYYKISTKLGGNRIRCI